MDVECTTILPHFASFYFPISHSGFIITKPFKFRPKFALDPSPRTETPKMVKGEGRRVRAEVRGLGTRAGDKGRGRGPGTRARDEGQGRGSGTTGGSLRIRTAGQRLKDKG